MQTDGEIVFSSERRYFKECYLAGIMEDNIALQQAYNLCMSDLIIEKWKPEFKKTDGYPIVKPIVSHRTKLQKVERIYEIKAEVGYKLFFSIMEEDCF